MDGIRAVSVKTDIMWQTGGTQDRFQEFPDNFADGEYHSPLVDLSKANKVPVAMFSAKNDHTCSNAHAHEYAPQFGVPVTLHDLPWPLDHGFFSRPTFGWFSRDLIAELDVHPSSFLQ